MQTQIEPYQNRPTRAVISLANLRNNFNIVKNHLKPGVKIMGVVKANAYGHGILRISEELLKMGANYLGVAFLEEAVYLRKNGINAPTLVLGAINADQVSDFIRYNIDIPCSSIDKSYAVSETAKSLGKTACVHLKIDTGMERIGVHYYNAEKFINETFSLPNMKVKGIFSHFAKAESDRDFTFEQIKRFDRVVDYMHKRNILPEEIHLANSGGIIGYPESHYTMVRPGIILYGYSHIRNFGENTIKPVMTLKTKVAYFKVVPADTGISYNHTYKTKEQTRIVTLPLGYGDGFNRLLSNRGEVNIRGKIYRIVGNICMDQAMVDIGPDGIAYNGDDVLIFGRDGDMEMPLENMCSVLNTIPYEVLCMIASRVPRIYTD